MRNKFQKAFTLVELIVVISIMTLITVSSTFYFIDFVKNKEIEQKIETIKQNLDNLDKNVEKYKIFDYELIFNTTTSSGGYITYLNKFDILNTQTLNINTSTFNGNIKISGANSTFTGTLKLYKKQKLFLREDINYDSVISFDFNTEPYYKIKSTLSGQTLNEIDLHYYAEDNLYKEKHNNLNLIAINTKEDKSGTSINKLIIKNIGGNKKFYNDDTSSEISNNKIFLFFENNSIEKFIKITK